MKRALNTTNNSVQERSIQQHFNTYDNGQQNTIKFYLDKLSGTKIDEYIAICLILENIIAKNELNDLWIEGLERFQNASLIRNYYNEFKLRESDNSLHSLNKLYKEKKYAQVISLFSNNEVAFGLDSDTLQQVSTSYMQIGEYEKAQKYAQKAATGFNLPKLRSLKETLMNKFETESKLQAWKKEMTQKTVARFKDSEDLDSWFDYSLSLIEEGEYKKSENILNLLVKNAQTK